MPYYVQRGRIPRKRHSIFRSESGQLLPEHLVGNKGFVGISSLLYHLRPPTSILTTELVRTVELEADDDRRVHHRHFLLHRMPEGGSPVLDRVPLMFNQDVAASLVRPDRSDDFFYRNAEADELVFVTTGEGVLETQFGDLAFSSGDYLVIPRSVIHRYRLTSPATMLVLEAGGYYRTPSRYRNEHGQMIEGAPFSERDIRAPVYREPVDEEGEFPILIKQYGAITRIVMDHHPCDIVGWDGFFFPWALSIHDFEPLVGRFHQPPPIHQTFSNDGFVVCSFCPRPYDFDPEAVPAPYNHSNVMSDEVLYYVSEDFMSRKGIEYGSMTLHPDGVPHGPHPGRTEASIGAERTDELAVMFDTFRSLRVAKSILTVEDKDYFKSWLDT